MRIQTAIGEWVSRGFVLIAVTCAVVSTVVSLRGSGSHSINLRAPKPKVVADWTQYETGGHRIGPQAAKLTIVEFADFECPVCGQFENRVLPGLRREFPNTISVVFREWPLAQHHLAYPAARAAECAGEQGRFQEYHDLLYAKQDSLGLLSFVDFAIEAGIPDTARFAACNARPGAVSAIDADVAAARRLGGRGTPTLIVNGLLLLGLPDSADLHDIVAAQLKKAG